MKTLSTGERIILVLGSLLLISSLFKYWATYVLSLEAGGRSVEQRDRAGLWSPEAFGLLPKVALVLVLLAMVIEVARLTELRGRESVGILYVGLCGLATGLLFVTVLTGPRDFGVGRTEATTGVDIGLDVERGKLLYLSVLLAAGATFGGYLHLREEAGGGSATGS